MDRTAWAASGDSDSGEGLQEAQTAGTAMHGNLLISHDGGDAIRSGSVGMITAGLGNGVSAIHVAVAMMRLNELALVSISRCGMLLGISRLMVATTCADGACMWQGRCCCVCIDILGLQMPSWQVSGQQGACATGLV